MRAIDRLFLRLPAKTWPVLLEVTKHRDPWLVDLALIWPRGGRWVGTEAGRLREQIVLELRRARASRREIARAFGVGSDVIDRVFVRARGGR